MNENKEKNIKLIYKAIGHLKVLESVTDDPTDKELRSKIENVSNVIETMGANSTEALLKLVGDKEAIITILSIPNLSEEELQNIIKDYDESPLRDDTVVKIIN